MQKPAKKVKHVSENHINQISVLKALSGASSITDSPRQFQINEIAQLAGLNDEKEVQRYLYILEGQKLVAPYPAGDFTSKVWHITGDGVKVLRCVSSAVLH